MKEKLKLGVLGSGKGSNFVAIADAIAAGQLDAEIVLVASDLPGAGILEEARTRNLPTWTCPPSTFKTKLEPEIEAELASKLQQAGSQIVVLAGFMRVIKQPLLDAFPKRIVNIHPSLLPAFKGLEAWKQALESGASESGCTVHWVTAELDSGGILAQERVAVEIGDSPETLHARIQVAEHRIFPAVLQKFATGEWKAGE